MRWGLTSRSCESFKVPSAYVRFLSRSIFSGSVPIGYGQRVPHAFLTWLDSRSNLNGSLTASSLRRLLVRDGDIYTDVELSAFHACAQLRGPMTLLIPLCCRMPPDYVDATCTSIPLWSTPPVCP
jgi:hypothetical protein